MLLDRVDITHVSNSVESVTKGNYRRNSLRLKQNFPSFIVILQELHWLTMQAIVDQKRNCSFHPVLFHYKDDGLC